MMVDQLLTGKLSSIPASPGVRLDFVYVENAAASHACALRALLDPSGKRAAGGRAFNVTNGEEPLNPLDFGSSLLAVARPTYPPLRSTPAIVWHGLAAISEGTFAFCCGNVPCRSHAFWNMTAASVGFTCTSISLDMTQTRAVLGFEPPFTYTSSFEDIACRSPAKRV
jgi:nucleoside-diphosphate-sugar epimerase